jgi:exodeoxyribonuclease VII large subunit
MLGQLRARREALNALAAQLELLNPAAHARARLCDRQQCAGKVLRSPGQIKPRDVLRVRLAEGSAEVGVASVQDLLE